MILDSSAIVAIVLGEPGFEALVTTIRGEELVGVGAPTLAETGIVLEARLGTDAQAILDRFLRDFDVTVVPFAADQWREAVDAFRRFGRGRHRAALDFGDCLAYATARASGDSLLYVGNDFSATDLPARDDT